MGEYRMLDLFSGLGGASEAMREDENWEVITVDKEEKFEPDICKDITEIKPSDFNDGFDLIWASPPCDRFTVAQIGRYWEKLEETYLPRNKEVIDRIGLVYHTLYLIEELSPSYWFLENPRGLLRKLIGKPQGTVTFCQYGDNRMKPTDLWGKHPESFGYKSCSNGDDCHESSPRGSKTGTQGLKNSSERAKIPFDLSEAVKESVENPKDKQQKRLDEVK